MRLVDLTEYLLLNLLEKLNKNNEDRKLVIINCYDIIEFNKNMKIINLKEFQSKSEHDYPYE